MDFPAGVGGNALETIGLDTANSSGTVITSGGTANTKGSYTQLVASTAFDYHAILVTAEYNSGGVNIMADIAVGAAASEQIVVPNLWKPKVDTIGERHATHILLPVGIKAGSRVAVRSMDGSGAASAWRCSMMGIGGDGIMHPGGSDVWAAVDTGNSRGVLVDPGTSANTKGSWTQITSSTPCQTRFLAVIASNLNIISNTYDGWLIDLAIGGAGSEQIILPDWFMAGEPASDIARAMIVFPAEIPAGTRIAARAQSNDTTANRRELGVAVYGVS